ncbi:MAG: hypothetical protein QXV17_11635 [Candidatus Micrarchaeaceae archaeon]
MEKIELVKKGDELAFFESEILKEVEVQFRFEGLKGDSFVVAYWNGAEISGLVDDDVYMFSVKAGYGRVMALRVGDFEFVFRVQESVHIFKNGMNSSITIII